MNNQTLIAVFGLLIAALSFLGNYLGAQKAQAAHDAVMEEKIDNLTKQVEKHNKLAERVAYLETVVDLLLKRGVKNEVHERNGISHD